MSTQTEEARVYDPRFAKLTEDQRELLFGYVSDMVALDSDIEAALDKQLGLTKSDSLAGSLVRGFHDAVRDQRNMMVDLRNGLGKSKQRARSRKRALR